MKKFLSVVLVAALAAAALASCSGDETATTTVAGTTAGGAGVNTTPAVTAPTTVTDPSGIEEVPETPFIVDGGLEELLAGKTLITDKVDMDSLASVGFNTWNETDENIDKMFDGVVTYDDWYFDEDGNLLEGADPETPKGGGPGKVGGGISSPAYFYFGLTEKAKVSAYVITTGNDNSIYPTRNPVEWTLYGTNDAEAFAKGAAAGLNNNPSGGDDTRTTSNDIPFDESKWTVLDYVYDGGMIEDNFTACGYAVDADKQGEFQYYVWVLGYNNGSFQITEFEMYVG